MNQFNQDAYYIQKKERALKKFESSAVLKLNRDVLKKENENLIIQKEILLQKNKQQAFLNEEHKNKIRIQELENHFMVLKNNNLEQEIAKEQLEKEKIILKQQEDQLQMKEQELYIKTV